MSRIQDILAKAEREGSSRLAPVATVDARIQSEPAFTPALAPVIAPVDGATALDPSPFLGAPMPMPAAPTAVEPRTARATLHPALVAAIEPHSPVAEQYRAIRTRLTQRDETGPLRTVMITSPGSRDGKSITAANLALTMAQEFQRNVVLVDTDLRGASVHTLFGVDAGVGLAAVLAGEATLDEALIHLPDYRLTLLPAGSTPRFPAELLGSTTMRRTVDMLRARFDRILLDTPAVAPLADVGAMAPLADGVLMVVRAGVTQRPALDLAVGAFEESKLLGVVLNDAK